MSRKLIRAVEKGDIERVRKLLEEGADVNKRSASFATNPLGMAAGKGQTEIAALLLDSGADVNSKDGIAWTALHSAAASGCTETAALLLDRGAPVNARDKYDRTPLSMATEKGHTETVALLMKRGATREPKTGGSKAGGSLRNSYEDDKAALIKEIVNCPACETSLGSRMDLRRQVGGMTAAINIYSELTVNTECPHCHSKIMLAI
jgi:Ankyrin repeats (3 copies)/Ankyrin repeat